MFLLDCEEETLSKQLLERAKDEKRIDNNVNTVAKRIQAYKEKTLPVLKHYDDMDKLFIVRLACRLFCFFFFLFLSCSSYLFIFYFVSSLLVHVLVHVLVLFSSCS